MGARRREEICTVYKSGCLLLTATDITSRPVTEKTECNMKALIIGATGATGKDLLNLLLNDPDYTRVIIFVRRRSGIAHSKLEEVLTDFEKPEAIADRIQGDVLFCLLGTTMKEAGSKEIQRHIDYEIPINFITVARRKGVPKIVLLSAYGASVASRVFYMTLKGELEDGIRNLAFDLFITFRPGLLLRKNTDRLGERISAPIIKFLNSIGIWRKFRPLPTSVLAEKMARAPKIFSAGIHVLELGKILEF